MSAVPWATLLVLGLGLTIPPVNGADREMIDRNSDFSTRLFRTLASRTDDNVVLATTAVSRGMAALLAGTVGTTRDQLQAVLRLAGLDPENITDPLSVMGAGALNLKQGVAFFSTADTQVSAKYAADLQSKYEGDVKTLDMSAPQDAVDAVNAWVRQQIGDQARDQLTALDPQTRLLLATAAFYRGRFRLAFNASVTQDERFYVDKYHVVTAPMMYRADKYFLAYDRALKTGVLKLPMTDGAAMLVVLPDDNVDIGSVEEEVNTEKIRAWIGQLKKTKLEVQLPRFTFEASYSLGDVLKTLGAVQVFQDDADLGNMGAAQGSKVWQVLHKAAVSMDESGGGDGPAGGFSGPQPRLTVNRPFLFVVYHESSGGLLLMGRLRDPTKT
ncbi:leukocyte elastase inhibitor-like [Corythoichthys intestinalis]|uniref:leukocyte elastase inhibitor-like n=1 Tax=Corythoichthys intestinalis TaxID=161448 RepID=UPI0025A5E5AE|nr:leukocyte elastase inhibitor-like [Corythoichthys intestinalis]XP_061806149.1 leukocyte elastase inhibitor-like [Nerophis lumbriciformis]